MLNAIVRQLARLASNLHPVSRHERELAHLNGSANLYDLEQRQIQIDRGLFRDQTLSLHFA